MQHLVQTLQRQQQLQAAQMQQRAARPSALPDLENIALASSFSAGLQGDGRVLVSPHPLPAASFKLATATGCVNLCIELRSQVHGAAEGLQVPAGQPPSNTGSPSIPGAAAQGPCRFCRFHRICCIYGLFCPHTSIFLAAILGFGPLPWPTSVMGSLLHSSLLFPWAQR